MIRLQGAIDETLLPSMLQDLKLRPPRVREFWELSQDYFVDSYKNYANRTKVEIDAEK